MWCVFGRRKEESKSVRGKPTAICTRGSIDEAVTWFTSEFLQPAAWAHCDVQLSLFLACVPQLW